MCWLCGRLQGRSHFRRSLPSRSYAGDGSNTLLIAAGPDSAVPQPAAGVPGAAAEVQHSTGTTWRRSSAGQGRWGCCRQQQIVHSELVRCIGSLRRERCPRKGGKPGSWARSGRPPQQRRRAHSCSHTQRTCNLHSKQERPARLAYAADRRLLHSRCPCPSIPCIQQCGYDAEWRTSVLLIVQCAALEAACSCAATG